MRAAQGHILHLLAAIRALTGAGLPVVVHAITDGRDVPPSSAAGFMDQLLAGQNQLLLWQVTFPQACSILF